VCAVAVTTLGSGALAEPAATKASPSNQPAHAAKAHPHRIARRSRERHEDNAQAGLSERLNHNTVAIVAGGLGSTDLTVAQELATVLDDGDNLRILPVVGAGGGRNIRDVRFLKGVDLGITQTNLLARLQASREIGTLDDKIVYLAKLFNEEVHLLVRADSGLTAIGELNGRTVSLGEPGSGTQLIGHDVLDRLGIKVHEVNLAGADAIARLRAGEIDAVVLIGGKPVPAVAGVAAGLRALPVPFAKPLRDDFLPATLTSEDYPGLIEQGREVETLAVGTVLIAYNWPKDGDHYAKIEKFVGAFFPRIAQLQASPRHPKWREINLAATLPGWTRFAAAQDWLDHHRDLEVKQRDQFEQFVRTHGGSPASADAREKLFRDFVKWSEARARR
jgi:TRAP transporter TAXI family solute receptor